MENKKKKSDKKIEVEKVYLPLQEIGGYLSFEDIEKGWLRVKVKDLNAVFKKLTGLEFKKISMVIIEEEAKEE